MAISETIPSKSGNFGAKNPSYELHWIFYFIFLVQWQEFAKRLLITK